MPKIKVVGYIDTDELPSEYVDLNHETGLSELGYDSITALMAISPYDISLRDLEDLDLTLED